MQARVDRLSRLREPIMIMENAYRATNCMRMACLCVEDGRLREAEQLVRDAKDLAEKLIEEIHAEDQAASIPTGRTRPHVDRVR
jgi:hypothetical protein